MGVTEEGWGDSAGQTEGESRRRLSVSGWAWPVAVLAIALFAIAFVIVTRARPAYDAMGFLVWGRQALDWNLNLNGAPSWKPLALIATLPYALGGLRVQQALWTLTAVAGAAAAVGLAARLAYRLSPVLPGRTWARLMGALAAGYGVATMAGFMHLTLIANSDPLIVALALGAIDCHLSRHPRAALALVWLAALGRPEAWPFLLLYALWLGRRQPGVRRPAAVAVLAVPAIWVVVPALTATDWMQPSSLALGQATAIHGDKLLGVLNRLRTLTAVPIQVALLVAFALAAVRRDRTVLNLSLAALLWVTVEVAFALHGYSAVQRYLIEPEAVLMVVFGIGVATALGGIGGPLRWLGAPMVVGLIVWLVPYNTATLRLDHGLISQAHTDATTLDRLARAIAADGGSAGLLACGRPVTNLTYQSTIAWELGVNVGSVGYGPRTALAGSAAVLFEPAAGGWSIRAIHASGAACTRLHRVA